MSCTPSAPYLDLLATLNERGVQYAVLASGGLDLDGVLQGTVDLGVAVDVGADNMMELVQVLAAQGYRFRHQATPLNTTGVPAEVVALTFSRRDRLEADVHIVLAPPSGWRAVAERVAWRPFGAISVPAVLWEVLLAVEEEKRPASHRPSRRDDLAQIAS